MRIIGYLENEGLARSFGDHLYAKGVANEIESDANGTWAVWVSDEGELDRAGEMLARFRENPGDPVYRDAHKAAEKRRLDEREETEAAGKRVYGRNDLFRPLKAYGVGPLTFFLILACVFVWFWSKMAGDLEAIQPLFITSWLSNGMVIPHYTLLPEVRQGEVWRLVTPILIHFGWMHILFNMMWLFQLGCMIEGRQGSTRFGLLVVVIATVSNLVQFMSTRMPVFGGMSGVVYGLFGYAWMRGKYDPASGLYIDRQTVIMMLVWFFVCFSGMVGPIANGAHAGGLVVGMFWGLFSAKAKWLRL